MASATPSTARRRRVIFILNQLDENLDLHRYNTKTPAYGPIDFAAKYYEALLLIVSCTIGTLDSVFVKFSPTKLFLLDMKQSNVPSGTQAQYHYLFAELFKNGVLVNHDTQQVYCREITGFNDLPHNSRIIAFVSGNNTASNRITVAEWKKMDLPDSSDPLVFVVGRGEGLEIQDRISLTVNVQNSNLPDIVWINEILGSL